MSYMPSKYTQFIIIAYSCKKVRYMKSLFTTLLLAMGYLAMSQSTPPQDSSSVQDTTIYTVAEHQAQYPGGITQMYAFIGEHLTYPAEALQQKGLNGKVIIGMVVEKDGTLTNIKVQKGLGYGCDEESMRVVSRMPKWEPALRHGKRVRMQVAVVFKFQN